MQYPFPFFRLRISCVSLFLKQRLHISHKSDRLHSQFDMRFEPILQQKVQDGIQPRKIIAAVQDVQVDEHFLCENIPEPGIGKAQCFLQKHHMLLHLGP